MAFIEWNTELSVGIKEIDDQHKDWLNIVNELHENINTGKSKETLRNTIDKLVKYSEDHFNTEERYMFRYQYPGYENHKKEHLDFTGKIIEFRDNFNLSTLISSLEVMDFLKKWLMHHILETDLKYSPFLLQKGLK